jgi:hypothetical protein
MNGGRAAVSYAKLILLTLAMLLLVAQIITSLG